MIKNNSYQLTVISYENTFLDVVNQAFIAFHTTNDQPFLRHRIICKIF